VLGNVRRDHARFVVGFARVPVSASVGRGRVIAELAGLVATARGRDTRKTRLGDRVGPQPEATSSAIAAGATDQQLFDVAADGFALL
jgi:hypothetical protein